MLDEEHKKIVEELDNRYEPKHKIETIVVEKKNNSWRNTGIIILIAIIVIAIIFYEDIEYYVTDYLEEPVPPVILSPAEMELYTFSALTSNTSVNVELWLINLGEETATNIEIYIRARNQNGTILFSAEISPTVLVLRDNETCSAIYTVPIETSDTLVTHTIEIEWTAGRIAYSKTTTL